MNPREDFSLFVLSGSHVTREPLQAICKIGEAMRWKGSRNNTNIIYIYLFRTNGSSYRSDWESFFPGSVSQVFLLSNREFCVLSSSNFKSKVFLVSIMQNVTNLKTIFKKRFDFHIISIWGTLPLWPASNVVQVIFHSSW